jgi:hypothetical protein
MEGATVRPYASSISKELGTWPSRSDESVSEIMNGLIEEDRKAAASMRSSGRRSR